MKFYVIAASLYLYYTIGMSYSLGTIKKQHLLPSDILLKKEQIYALQDTFNFTQTPPSNLKKLCSICIKLTTSLAIAELVQTIIFTYAYTPTNQLAIKKYKKKKALLHGLNNLYRCNVEYQDAIAANGTAIQRRLQPTITVSIPAMPTIPDYLLPEKTRQADELFTKNIAAESKKNHSLASITLFITTTATSYWLLNRLNSPTKSPCKKTLVTFFNNWEYTQTLVPLELFSEFSILNLFFEEYNLEHYLTEKHAQAIMMLLDMQLIKLLHQLNSYI